MSYTGFYNTVRDAAATCGYEVLTLAEAQEADWVRAVNTNNEIYITVVRFVPVKVGAEAAMNSPILSQRKLFVHNSEDLPLGELSEYCSSLLYNKNSLKDRFTKTLIEQYDDKTGYFKGMHRLVQLKFSSDGTWYLLDQIGQRYKLEAFTFDFECRIERFNLKPELFSYNEAQVATITKELPNLKVILR